MHERYFAAQALQFSLTFYSFSSVTVQQTTSCFGVYLSIRHSGRALGTEAVLVHVSGRWAESQARHGLLASRPPGGCPTPSDC